ncbi:Cerato-platanin [Panus rudis PR-1116 ss-1]|nr:Cerato-platanin [Panus rudis PR-1116 ss-1]
MPSLLVAISAIAGSSAATVSVSFDETYDNGSQSLATVSCSDGQNGLLTKGFTTFSSLPSFPNIGGAPAVGGWNSEACGTCWELTFNGTSINVLAIDSGASGFNIALGAMNKLTNGQAVALGRVNANATQVNATACGLH